MSYDINIPPVLRIGAGSVKTLGGLVTPPGATRPLVVTDPFLVSSGVAGRIAGLLNAAGADAALYDGTIPDPTSDSLADGLAAATAHRADALVAVGGGSPI